MGKTQCKGEDLTSNPQNLCKAEHSSAHLWSQSSRARWEAETGEPLQAGQQPTNRYCLKQGRSLEQRPPRTCRGIYICHTHAHTSYTHIHTHRIWKFSPQVSLAITLPFLLHSSITLMMSFTVFSSLLHSPAPFSPLMTNSYKQMRPEAITSVSLPMFCLLSPSIITCSTGKANTRLDQGLANYKARHLHGACGSFHTLQKSKLCHWTKTVWLTLPAPLTI